MKICPNCNALCEDNSKFCVKCGNVLPETPISAPAPGAPMSAGAPGVPVYAPAPEAAPKKKSPVKLILILAVAAMALYFVISKVLFLMNPAGAIIGGLKAIAGMDKSTITSTISFDYSGDEDDDLSILNDVTVKLVSAADLKNLLAEISIEALYSNKSVVKVGAGVNNDYVYIDPQKLYKKKMYSELDEILPGAEDYIQDIKIIMNALSSMDLKFDAGKYSDVVKKALGKDLKGSFSTVTLKIDQETSNELLLAILEKAAKDDALIESIRTGATKAINQIIKDKKFNESFIEKDDLESLLEEFEDKKAFKDNFKDALSEAVEELEYQLEYYEDYDIEVPYETTVTFRFDLFNRLTGIDYVMEGDVDGENMKIIISNAIKGGASFTKINTKDAIEIQELASDYDEQEEVLGVVMDNLIKSIKSNKELTKRIEDFTGEDIDDIEDFDDLQYLFGVRRLPAM